MGLGASLKGVVLSLASILAVGSPSRNSYRKRRVGRRLSYLERATSSRNILKTDGQPYLDRILLLTIPHGVLLASGPEDTRGEETGTWSVLGFDCECDHGTNEEIDPDAPTPRATTESQAPYFHEELYLPPLLFIISLFVALLKYLQCE